MLTIYKYTIPVLDYFFLKLPLGAKILSVQEQYDRPQIWALVDPQNPTETRNFRLAGTGHPIKEAKEILNFIGAFQLEKGTFIGHLFEIKKE
ncbi:MAG: hypothetical protein WC306_02255 [Candidatus Paceibacterota bacterium]|jgi:hypothetical protein